MKYTIEVRNTHEGWKVKLREGEKDITSYYGPTDKLAVLLDEIAVKIIKREKG